MTLVYDIDRRHGVGVYIVRGMGRTSRFIPPSELRLRCADEGRVRRMGRSRLEGTCLSGLHHKGDKEKIVLHRDLHLPHPRDPGTIILEGEQK